MRKSLERAGAEPPLAFMPPSSPSLAHLLITFSLSLSLSPSQLSGELADELNDADLRLIDLMVSCDTEAVDASLAEFKEMVAECRKAAAGARAGGRGGLGAADTAAAVQQARGGRAGSIQT